MSGARFILEKYYFAIKISKEITNYTKTMCNLILFNFFNNFISAKKRAK